MKFFPIIRTNSSKLLLGFEYYEIRIHWYKGDPQIQHMILYVNLTFLIQPRFLKQKKQINTTVIMATGREQEIGCYLLQTDSYQHIH